jgi:hypothetical protein
MVTARDTVASGMRRPPSSVSGRSRKTASQVRQQHGEGGGLDAAAAGGRRGTDAHQQDQHQVGGCTEGIQGNSVETCRAACDGLEQAVEHHGGNPCPVFHLQTAVPLEHEERQGTQHHQQSAGDKHDAGAQGQPCVAAAAPPAPHLGQHEKSQPAAGDQHHHHGVDPQVVAPWAKAVRLKGEPRIAECGHGMEQSGEERFARGLVEQETCGQQQRPQPFDHQCDAQHLQQQGQQTADGAKGQAVLKHLAVEEGNSPRHQVQKADRKGHDAQAARLDQQQDDPLAEQGEPRARVQHRQAGDTHGGGGGEQGVHHSDAGSGRAGQQQ